MRINYGTDIGHMVFYYRPEEATKNGHNGKAKLENFNRLSRAHERYRQMTDDRRTDDST